MEANIAHIWRLSPQPVFALRHQLHIGPWRRPLALVLQKATLCEGPRGRAACKGLTARSAQATNTWLLAMTVSVTGIACSTHSHSPCVDAEVL